nr:immunoglobulin light chain junction region [Mus musculus]NSL98554.1 immunoglobulin light chain junction region [Mus musculus]NSL98853.1 immunoglobulin light chain junction region [Mus musculus]NSM00297.1 immunoglobulin light chain junction region [Mus musculus]NSM01195.1 immunoglobulin light chain junction region [Mus musculus]
CQQSRKVPSTF